MPAAGPAVGAIATAVGTFLTSKAAVYVVARLVAFAAVTAILAKRAFAFDPGISSRAITSRGTVEPQQKIYGQALVSGPVVFNDVAGVANRDLWVVIPLAGHQVSSITDVWLDKDVVANSAINGGASAGGAVTTGKFAPVDGFTVLQIWKHLGASGQTVNTTLDAAFTAWTSAHRLRGIAYLAVRMTLLVRAEELWNGSEPTNIRALVNGALVYDPRLDSTQTSLSPAGSGSHRYDNPTTWAWSENPALCVADYLIDTRFGMGLDPTRIDWQSVLDAAEYCEDLVDIPGPSTQQRFTCNGSLYGTETHRDNLQNLLSSMNGELTVSAGLWSIRAGQYVAPASGDDFTADDVIEPLGIKANLERAERFNTIKGVFIDSADYYKPSETPPVYTTALRDRDNGRILETEINLPFTDDFYEAQRLCWQQLHIANQEKVVSTTLNHRAGRVAVGDRLNLEIDELAWSPKVFKLRNWKLVESGDSVGVEVSLREDASSAYADPVIANYAVRNSANVITFADPAPAFPESASEGLIRDPTFRLQHAQTGAGAGSLGTDSGYAYWAASVSTWTLNPLAENGSHCAYMAAGLAGTLIPVEYIPAVNGERFYLRARNYFASGFTGTMTFYLYQYAEDRTYLGTFATFGTISSPTTGVFATRDFTAAVNDADTAFVRFGVVGPNSAQPYRLTYLQAKRQAFEATVGAVLGTNLLTSGGTTVGDDAVVRWEADPSNSILWTTYEAGGWSPADTTLAITMRCFRGSTQIASRVVDFTLTASGANEGDIAAAGGTSTGDANTVSITGNNSAAVTGYVQHTATGVRGYFAAASSLPGYSGGVSK